MAWLLIFAIGARLKLGADGGNHAAKPWKVIHMRKFLTITVAALALAGFGYGFAASVNAQDIPADLKALPIFPAEKTEVKAAPAVPVHATHRIQTGKTVRFLACRESRDVRGNQELRCLSWNAKKGWSKSPKWVPAYQLTAAR